MTLSALLTVLHESGLLTRLASPAGPAAAPDPAVAAIAPREMAWPANFDPSACSPRSATNTEPGAAARES